MKSNRQQIHNRSYFPRMQVRPPPHQVSFGPHVGMQVPLQPRYLPQRFMRQQQPIITPYRPSGLSGRGRYFYQPPPPPEFNYGIPMQYPPQFQRNVHIRRSREIGEMEIPALTQQRLPNLRNLVPNLRHSRYLRKGDKSDPGNGIRGDQTVQRDRNREDEGQEQKEEDPSCLGKRKFDRISVQGGSGGVVQVERRVYPARKKRKVEVNTKFTADQTFQLFAQMMVCGYFERNKFDEVPLFAKMVVHHFEVLRKSRVMKMPVEGRNKYFQTIIELMHEATKIPIDDIKRDVLSKRHEK